MNRIFKVIWNRSRGQYVVADENCNSHGKGRTVLALAVSAMLSLPGITDAGITGHTGTNVSKSGNVYHVTTTRQSGNIGFNRFSEFNLPAKEIANLHHPSGANHLVNFVKSQITIDGTVNSVLSSNKIGGNLYFVTPTGFTVGSTGVINAGSVTAAVVKSADFDKWDGHVGKEDYSDFTGNNGALLTAFRNGEVPVNPTGVITVNGSINAGNGITLTASKINVGNGASLKTGVSDFSNLVNIKDGQGNVSSDAGVDGIALTDPADGTGDIILFARGDATGQLLFTESNATVEITGNAVIDAKAPTGSTGKASVVIASDAQAGVQKLDYDKKQGKYVITAKRDDADIHNTVTALTKIGSGASISADGLVTVAATADNKMSASFIEKLRDDILQYVWETTPISQIAAYATWAKLKTNADVVIEEGATVTGGTGVGIEAKSRTILKAEGASGIERTISYDWAQNVPAIGVSVGIGDSDAHVDVKGTVKSGGDLAIGAKNEIESTVTGEMVFRNTTDDPVAVSVAVLNGSAKVDVADTATLDMTDGNGSGNLVVAAEQKGKFKTTASAKDNEGSRFALSFAWADIDTAATVNLNTGVTGSANNVSVVTDNTVSQLRLTSDTGNIAPVGLGDLYNQIKSNVATAVVAAVLKKSVQELKSEVPQFDTSFKGGVAGAVLRYGQHATTNVNGISGITALGEAEVASSSLLSDHYFKAEGGYKVKSEEGGVNGGAIALLVTTDKKGGVTADTSVGDGAVLSADGKLTVSSSTKIPYGRVDKMIEDVKTSWATALGSLASLVTKKDLIKIEEKKDLLIKKLEEYRDKTAGSPGLSPVGGNDENIEDVLKAVSEYYGALSSVGSQIGGLFSGGLGLWTTTRDFLNFTNYTNVYVGAGGRTEAHGGDAWSAQGAFAWNALSASSQTTIGRGAKLTAGSELRVSADEQLSNVMLAGYFPRFTTAMVIDVMKNFVQEGDAAPIGATLGMQFIEGHSAVTVMEGAELVSENGDVVLNTKGDTVSVGISGAASKTNGTTAVTAMGNVIVADLTSEISVDDEATIKSKKQDVELTAENDASLQSIAASMAWQSGREATGAGMAGVAVIVSDVTADVTVADNDGDRNVYNVDGLLSASAGTVRAKADADTKSNAIGAAMAGTAAKSQGAKDLKPDFIKAREKPGLGVKAYQLLNKARDKFVNVLPWVQGAAGEAAGANNAGQNPVNPVADGNNAQMGEAIPLNDQNFQLDAAGSVGWNMVDVYSTVNLGAVKKTKTANS